MECMFKAKVSGKIRDICQCSLATPCATRWNSLYDSIIGLLDKRLVLPKVMSALQLPCLKDADLEFLEEYRQILAPIAVALDRLQGERNCSYGELLPTLLKVNSQLNSLQSVNFRYCTPLLSAVTFGFQRRFLNFLNLTPEINTAILATMSHPYFKLRWLPQSFSDQRIRLQALLVTTAKSNSLAVHAEYASSESGDNDDEYFSFTQSTADAQPISDTTKCELEVLKYLEESKKDLSVLDNFPLIKSLHLKYNAILPSSAPVERLFSLGGIINRPHRRGMGDNTFERLLLLKGN